MAVAICVFALLVIVFVSQSARFSQAYLSGPIVSSSRVALSV